MEYIVMDFEWNQPRSESELIKEPFYFDSEIIEIGAVKLNDSFETISEFKTYISPVFYSVLNGGVSRLTHISKSVLKQALPFDKAYASFIDWCGDEYSFMTWGPTDLPVLMDNLLMHNMPLDTIPVCYDLQRIFGNEILRENRQCSLENAMKMLNLPMERSHDALHDSKNTVKIANFMDLSEYIDEYQIKYTGYAQDRLGFADKLYGSLSDAVKSQEVSHFTCEYCGNTVECSEWSPFRGGRVIGYAQCENCPDAHEYFVRVTSHRRARPSIAVYRTIFEMSDDLWDIYQDTIEGI